MGTGNPERLDAKKKKKETAGSITKSSRPRKRSCWQIKTN
jgi:hypothetical protein